MAEAVGQEIISYQLRTGDHIQRILHSLVEPQALTILCIASHSLYKGLKVSGQNLWTTSLQEAKQPAWAGSPIKSVLDRATNKTSKEEFVTSSLGIQA